MAQRDLTRLRAPAAEPKGDLPPALLGHGVRTLVISHIATVLALGCVAGYAFLPGAAVERGRLLVVLGVYGSLAVLVSLVPWPRLFQAGRAMTFLTVWSLTSIGLIGIAIGVTGGATSPLYPIYGLTAVFFAAAYSLRGQAILAALTMCCYGTAVALGGGAFELNSVFIRVATFLLISGLAANLSAELHRQLQAHVEAHRELEARADELARLAAENKRLALHDALTGLANRTLFGERVERALAAATRHGHEAAVLVIDLDGFKEVNDILGHESGDALLRQIGPRLESALRGEDTVARMGGDEFAVLLPEVHGAEGATAVAHKLAQAFEVPFALAGVTLAIESSIGVALFPEHGETGDDLVRHADAAMYGAKEDRTGWALYGDGHADDDLSPRRLALLGEIRTALERNELVVYYQPMVDMQAGTLRGVEALVRWQHPVRGLVPPIDFVPVVEQTSLIGPLTLAVLDQALAQARLWRDAGREIPVSVNLSVRNLHDEGFPDSVAALLARHRLPPSVLELELTESSIMTQPKRAIAVLEQLDRMGVALVLDDFGTGYSSLARLTRLPVSELKIDRGFVMNMSDDPNNVVIVRSMINIGRNLGLTVVAEGVEDEQTWNQLVHLGCEIAQGYYLSRPVPAAELEGWIDRLADERHANPGA